MTLGKRYRLTISAINKRARHTISLEINKDENQETFQISLDGIDDKSVNLEIVEGEADLHVSPTDEPEDIESIFERNLDSTTINSGRFENDLEADNEFTEGNEEFHFSYVLLFCY